VQNNVPTPSTLATIAVLIVLWTAAASTLVASPAASHTPKSGKPACFTLEEITANSAQADRDVCASLHVYNVVVLPDGTRFLDVCPAELPDDQCRFTIVSMPADREQVGDLRKYRDQDVQVRGIVHAMHGRMGIVLSHSRQFSSGPEKFKPNPKLLHDFNGQSDRMPVRDPNLAASGRHRSFMNSADKEELPSAKRP
jgi:hypothetical protein